jgi:hypothetical protein
VYNRDGRASLCFQLVFSSSGRLILLLQSSRRRSSPEGSVDIGLSERCKVEFSISQTSFYLCMKA